MMNTATQAMIVASINPTKCEAILKSALAKMKAINATPDETQIEVLTNHLIEMVTRSENNEPLMAIDPTVFSELSEDSLTVAAQIVEEIGHLNTDEKYVLAVHFEVAKNKEEINHG